MKTDTRECLSMVIKHQNENDFEKFITSLIHESAALIGQQKIEQHIELLAYRELGRHIKRHYTNYTIQELRKALIYGYQNDQTQGGSIYAQRLIFWIDKYHKEVWLPKNKHKIHNQPEMKSIAPKEITPQETILNNYRSWKRGLIGYSFVRVFQALDELGLKNDLWNNTVAWKFIYQAANKLKAEANENQLFKEFRNIEAKIKRIENGNIKTVSGDIIAEAKRLMVKELFENSSEDEIKMLIN